MASKKKEKLVIIAVKLTRIQKREIERAAEAARITVSGYIRRQCGVEA